MMYAHTYYVRVKEWHLLIFFFIIRKHLLDPAPEEDHVPPPEFRPGGFNWGGNAAEIPPGRQNE